jgi:hypothetical protein
MKSIKAINKLPAGVNLTSDDIIEFHAARILLLIFICGSKNKVNNVHAIAGLTKLAKLDFFVRYPAFFNQISSYLKKNEKIIADDIDSKMIRFHYGPWDKRYYQVLPYLEARSLIKIEKFDKQYSFSLTSLGEQVAKSLKKNKSYLEISKKMKSVGKILRTKSGNTLKELIYKVFDQEVKNKNLDEIINA